MESLRISIEAGDEHPVGRTTKPVTGFKGRSGRSFRAKLRVEKSDDGKWRVEFDEDWATGGTPPPAEDEGSGDGAAGEGEGEAAAGAEAEAEKQPQPVTSE
jgi:DNA topoisomerase-3